MNGARVVVELDVPDSEHDDGFHRPEPAEGCGGAVPIYAQALVGFIMQSTACNAIHSVEQHLARWLLMAHDRMERDDFPMTHEFIAMMLGTSRPMVTVVAGTLQKAGLTTYHRGSRHHRGS